MSRNTTYLVAGVALSWLFARYYYMKTIAMQNHTRTRVNAINTTSVVAGCSATQCVLWYF